MSYLLEHSDKYLPAFCLLNTPRSGRVHQYGALDFRYELANVSRYGALPTPLPNEGETALRRWRGLATGFVSMAPDGTPGASSGRYRKVLYGNGDFLLTDSRLLLLAYGGEAVTGKLGAGKGVLAVVFPLNRVDSVWLDLRPTLFRGLKEDRVTVANLTGGGFLTVETLHEVLTPQGWGKPRSGDGLSTEVLQPMVAPVVAARRPTAGQAELAQLDRVAAGSREVIEPGPDDVGGGAIVITFAVEGDRSVVSRS